ncbi:hypothetical protein ACH35V_02885 [Actinomadura sp. 1N219]|uniref:hypothetical protein n=1 Tax=Actinomadura sp. 1N219 TaxID=3375152 RepID=UPI0037B8CB07
MNFAVNRLSDAHFAPERARMRIEQIEKEQKKLADRLDFMDKKARKSMRRFLRNRHAISRSEADRWIAEMIESRDQEIAALAAEKELLLKGGESSRSETVPLDAILAMWNAANVHERRDMLTTALGTDRLLVDHAPDDRSRHAVLRVEIHPT